MMLKIVHSMVFGMVMGGCGSEDDQREVVDFNEATMYGAEQRDERFKPDSDDHKKVSVKYSEGLVLEEGTTKDSNLQVPQEDSTDADPPDGLKATGHISLVSSDENAEFRFTFHDGIESGGEIVLDEGTTSELINPIFIDGRMRLLIRKPISWNTLVIDAKSSHQAILNVEPSNRQLDFLSLRTPLNIELSQFFLDLSPLQEADDSGDLELLITIKNKNTEDPMETEVKKEEAIP